MVASVSETRIYLDANVFIAAYETRGARSDHAWWILRAIEAKEFVAVTSELTLAEILVGPIRDGDDELAGHYHDIVTSGEGFEVAAVDRQVLIEAALLRSMSRSLKLPDAIHVATGRLRDCRFIVSDDRRLPNAPGLAIVQLGPHALDVMRAQVR
jgi:predicted nucleic acid-binding protein